MASEAEQEKFIADVRDNIKAFMEDTSVSTLLKGLMEQYRQGQIDDFRGNWLRLFDTIGITPDTELVRNKDTAVSLKKDKGFHYVRVGGSVLRYMEFMEETITFLLSAEGFTIREIPGNLEEPAKLTLAKKWIEAGIFHLRENGQK